MQKNNLSRALVCLSLIYTAPAHCNLIWPALLVTHAIFSSIALIFISIAIEAALLLALIQGISHAKALLMSLAGNAASVILGSIVMTIAMIGWHFAADSFLGGTFNLVNMIATYVLMYLGSSVIELFTLKLLFRYSARQLWVPVFVGNFITYFLTALFNLK